MEKEKNRKDSSVPGKKPDTGKQEVKDTGDMKKDNDTGDRKDNRGDRESRDTMGGTGNETSNKENTAEDITKED